MPENDGVGGRAVVGRSFPEMLHLNLYSANMIMPFQRPIPFYPLKSRCVEPNHILHGGWQLQFFRFEAWPELSRYNETAKRELLKKLCFEIKLRYFSLIYIERKVINLQKCGMVITKPSIHSLRIGNIFQHDFTLLQIRVAES